MKERLLRNRDGQTLEEFLAAYHPKDYPHPSVTVDLVVVSLEGRRPELLMVRRGNHPCLDCWALPGGFVLPCSSVRLIRYYRTADDTEEDFYAHF